MISSRYVYLGILALFVVALLVPVSSAQAADVNIVPILSPRIPPPVPNPKQINPDDLVNNLPLPAPSIESIKFALGLGPENIESRAEAVGFTLASISTACLNFDSKDAWRGDVFTDQFAGWGTYAVDDGYYRAENVRFEMERAIAGGNLSAKIASDKPYAAGLASPHILVTPGDTITVNAKYYIREHDEGKVDWAALGVKGDAYSTEDLDFKNGYVRNKWAKFSRTVSAESSEAQVLLVASSPRNLNSNIYFDEIEILVNGEAISDCGLAK